MRKLASVQRVEKITEIPNADRIELAHILGWQCVIKKGEFKAGDKGVYFEPDSFLPEREEFEFLRKSSFRENSILGRGFRLRTQKLRGEISQGLLLPLTILPEGKEYTIGDDVTEILGVKKWEEPERAGDVGTFIGSLPDFIHSTDETRVQSAPDLFTAFKGKPYYITTKMDGTSCSCGVDAYNEVKYTTHNHSLKDDGKSTFINLLKRKGIVDNLLRYKEEHSDINTISVQGELCGDGIQGNHLKLQKLEWYVFTININGRRVGLNELQAIVKELGAEMVPLEETGDDLTQKYATIEDLLNRADGEYPNGGKKEGIVIRPIEVSFYNNSPLSMKVINNKYLLKYDD